MDITTIDLLRHGQCEDGHCYRGSTDVALTANGWQQMANSLSQVDSSWQRIIASPLIRCAHFAQQLAEQHQLPLQKEYDLRELHFGDWEGQAVDTVWETQQAAVIAWGENPVTSPPPGGEAADTFADRVSQIFLQLIKQYSGEHLLLISHGGVMRAILTHCLAMPLYSMNRFDIPYGCLSRLQVILDQDQYHFRLLNHNMRIDHD